MIRVYIDGSANPRKMTAAIGIIMIENGSQERIAEKLSNYHDNHEAEFHAFQRSLEILLEQKKEQELILCHSDSKTLVDAVEKQYAKKESHRELLEQCLILMAHFSQIHLTWIPEKDNKGADQLARNALYKKTP